MSENNVYIINDPEKLNLRFYQNFDPYFLANKVISLHLIVEQPDLFRNMVDAEEGNSEYFDKEFFQSINAHIHCAEFQQFEAFFALLLAVFQDLPHWLYLTTYGTREIKEKVNNFIKGDIKKLTDNKLNSMSDFINHSIYLGSRSIKEDQNLEWDKNINNIEWLLNRFARKYIDAPEYNAYKHGLRIITGPTHFSMRQTGSSTPAISYQSDDSLRYLETKKMDDGSILVQESFQHFNPIESINHMSFMGSILETIKNVRYSSLAGTENPKINTFFSLDRESLNLLLNRTKWSISI